MIALTHRPVALGYVVLALTASACSPPSMKDEVVPLFVFDAKSSKVFERQVDRDKLGISINNYAADVFGPEAVQRWQLSPDERLDASLDEESGGLRLQIINSRRVRATTSRGEVFPKTVTIILKYQFADWVTHEVAYDL